MQKWRYTKKRTRFKAREILIIPYRKIIWVSIIYSFFNRFSCKMKNKRGRDPSTFFILFISTIICFPIFPCTISLVLLLGGEKGWIGGPGK